MGVFVYLLVPETKGRSLESMDEIFGTAYGNETEVELGRRETGIKEGNLEPGALGMRLEIVGIVEGGKRFPELE